MNSKIYENSPKKDIEKVIRDEIFQIKNPKQRVRKTWAVIRDLQSSSTHYDSAFIEELYCQINDGSLATRNKVRNELASYCFEKNKSEPLIKDRYKETLKHLLSMKGKNKKNYRFFKKNFVLTFINDGNVINGEAIVPNQETLEYVEKTCESVINLLDIIRLQKKEIVRLKQENKQLHCLLKGNKCKFEMNESDTQKPL